MEREPPKKIFQLKEVCIMLPFCIKYETTGPPRSTRGLPPLSMNDECHIHECIITFDFLSGTGFD